MKYLKLFEELINEIGDASAKQYKTKVKSKTPNYELHTFKTETEDYEVTFDFQEDWSKDEEWIEMSIDFSSGGGYDSHVVTNRGEMYRVMATIVALAKKIVKKNKNIKSLSFTGSKNRGDNDNRRNNLYMAYIKKHVKAKNIEDDGNRIVVDL